MTQPDGNRHWIENTARALVWPPALGRAAAFAPWWWCWLAGSASAAFVLGAWGAGPANAGSAPFRDLAHYLREGAELALFMALIGFIPIAYICFWFTGNFHLRWRVGHVARARLRACLLAPVACLPLAIAWHLCLMFEAAQNPGCSFTWAAKPAWMMWNGFGVFAWILGPLVAVWLVASATHGATVAAQLAPTSAPNGTSCGSCGYDLSGLTGAVCPECGAGSARAAR